jgi:linoleoyl-CoA desaturase
MVVKTVLLYTLYLGTYGLLLSGAFNIWGMWALCVAMGVGKAGLGMSVAHDAIHGAYSARPWVNRLLSKTMNLIGGSDYVWRITHNRVHHTWTNIHEVDEDLALAPFIRLSPHARWMPVHRAQQYFSFLVYGLATLFWVFAKDYKKMAQRSIGPVLLKHHWKDVAELVAFKLFYYTYMLVVPLLVLDVAWWQFAIGFLTVHFTAGIILGVVFQLAHVVEGTQHFAQTPTGTMENSWAIHQMRTTNNFGRTNPILTWFAGGLNFQVEHHLFPTVCSVHYPALNAITQRVARQHGVPYHEHRSFRAAVASHYRTLRNFGYRVPRPAPAPALVAA